MPDDPRLEALEKAVRELSQEVARLAREVDANRAGRTDGTRAFPLREVPADPRPPRAAIARAPARGTPTRSAGWRGLALETLIGRYAALALAAVAILLGVGVFLSWAVEHVELGPGLRVLLGMLAAAGVAALGVVLRRRGARRFGNVLLGLALAIVHVVAWGAGPYLHVVSSITAFAGAAVASAALAVLAWRENEEALFSVGVGGALLAPFVTSEGGEQIFQLLGFGTLVLGAGMLAMRDRPWRFAARILMAGATLYAGAGLESMAVGLAAERVAPAAFVLVCTWIALALVASPIRLSIGRATTALSIAALLFVALSRREALLPELIAAALAATVTTHLLLHRTRDVAERIVAPLAVILPLGALAAALLSIPDMDSTLGALIAAAWTAIAAIAAGLEEAGDDEPAREQTATVRDAGRRRDAHLLVVALGGATAVVLVLLDHAEWCVLALGVWTFGLALLNRRLRSDGMDAGILVVLAVASLWALGLLLDRPAYAYTPFFGATSAAAVSVLAAWWAVATSSARNASGQAGSAASGATGLAAGSLTVGWGYVELARAFAPDVATFLVILYLAATGITAILVGRARRLPAARHGGLALAIFAGIKALVQASTMEFGFRLASFLVVGAFLLGVAYVYRATAEQGA